jgi:hypothetical protein
LPKRKNGSSTARLDKKITDTQPIIDGFDGLMARINALNKLPSLPHYLSCYCFSIEHLLLSLNCYLREYDFKLEDLETALKATIEQDKYQRNLLVKTSAMMHDKV